MKMALGIAVVAGLASGALASSVVATFTSYGTASFTNIDSIAVQGTAGNATGTWTATGGGTVNAIRVSGTLNSVIGGTYSSEAGVRFSAGAGNSFSAFNHHSFTGNGFTSVSVGPSAQFAVTPFTLAAGDVNFEWFDSYDDGAGADSNWANVSYEFGNGSTTVVNGNYAQGSLNDAGVPLVLSGSHVSGGLDFYTFTIPAGVSPGGYLSLFTGAGSGTSMNDTELALYDSAGNFVATDDDGTTGFFSQLSFGASDPNFNGETAAGVDGLTLGGGTYTLVVAGYDSTFGATIGAITPGTNAGSYSLTMQYVPTPGALALLGLGGLVVGRRRR